jgi:hypothetical protein
VLSFLGGRNEGGIWRRDRDCVGAKKRRQMVVVRSHIEKSLGRDCVRLKKKFRRRMRVKGRIK